MKLFALVKQGINPYIVGIFESKRKAKAAFKFLEKHTDKTRYHHDFDGYHDFYVVPLKLNEADCELQHVGPTWEIQPYDPVRDGRKVS